MVPRSFFFNTSFLTLAVPSFSATSRPLLMSSLQGTLLDVHVRRIIPHQESMNSENVKYTFIVVTIRSFLG